MPFDEERTETRTIEVPGMMIIAQFTLGGQGRSVQFSKSVDTDLQDREIDDMLDRLCRAADRQAARYSLPGSRRQLAMTEEQLADNQRRLAATQDELRGFQNKRLEEARKIEKEYGSIYDALYLEHHRKGYQGEFEPRGADAQQLKRMKDAIAELANPAGGKEADLIGNLSQLENEVAKGEVLVRRQREVIAEDERIARGEDVSGV